MNQPIENAELHGLLQRLQLPLPEIPSRYFYDAVGSDLFVQITELPEYYQTRTELGLLKRHMGEVMEQVRPQELVELGSGAGRKIRTVLDVFEGSHCAFLDVSESYLSSSLESLRPAYPSVEFSGIQGSFLTDLQRLGPGGGPRLIAFFGSTIGNLKPSAVAPFLRSVKAQMKPGDAFLVGFDLVKDHGMLEAAYNDASGVTAAFNRNILSVLNNRFEANFDLGSWEHVAFFDPAASWIEMRLRATASQQVHLGGRTLRFDKGGEIRTEVSCKFTKAQVEAYAGTLGLSLQGWFTDERELFALALMGCP